MMGNSVRPLEGLLVVDFSTLLPGPLGTEILVQAGARVVKIERPGSGDDMREYQPRWGSSSTNFALLNAGKESISIDLKSPEALRSVKSLIARADVVIEQFRPGVMARLGLDYESVKQKNPRIVYCSISGFGQQGPKRDVAAHDLNYIAETGLLALSMGPVDAPVVPPALIADIAAGTFPAVMNILLALYQRHATGKGCYLDMAMTDALFTFHYWGIGRAQASGEWPRPGRELVTGGSPRYNLYPTSDGRVVAAAPIEQKFWDNFCDVIELDDEFRRDEERPAATLQRARELIRAKDSTHWTGRFAGVDCCCNIVRTLEEAMDDPHFIGRGLFSARVQRADGAEMGALPLPLAPVFRSTSEKASRVPSLGEHNSKVLGEV
jgi:crotonobetainyl-CoA:carnitine CoA-transferase CaiB-like acyl-CoA transferase